MDVNIEATGPFTGEFLVPEERGPRPVTEESVKEYDRRQPELPGVSQKQRMIHAERAIRLLNKAYNNRVVILKNAMNEFHKATGVKPVMAKEEVWLPDRKISHAEFITHLQPLIKEFSA